MIQAQASTRQENKMNRVTITRTPITADEVREGDLVRMEFGGERAVEGRTEPITGTGMLNVNGYRVADEPVVTAIYLLDRPTPPKIPADAEYVTWVTPSHGRRSAHKTGYDKWSIGGISGPYTLDGLLGRIGDAEVTVLVPKGGKA